MYNMLSIVEPKSFFIIEKRFLSQNTLLKNY